MQFEINKKTAVEKNKKHFYWGNLAEDTGFLMLQIANLWGNSHDRALKRYHGLSHMQYAILASVCWLVNQNGQQVTQSILAQHTKINPMTVSQIFKVLEKKGYIYRTTHPNDVRAKSVTLTPAGIELMDKAVKTIHDVDAKFFKILGKNTLRFNRQLHSLLKAND